MHGNRARYVLAAALAACALAGSAGCRKKIQPDLVLLSPHNYNIQTEFERAFRKWHKDKFGRDVVLEWRDVGGSTSNRQFLLNQYAHAASSGIDLYFGGGGPDHMLLTRKGITQPVKLPPELLAKLPESIGGIQQYDADGRWYGAALSCFGIIYNDKLLRARKLPIPRRWDDLAAPAMNGWIEAADATQSGSARAAYEMIIQSAPDWPAGWAKLLKIFGNCKRFTGGASEIPTDVGNGEVLAGAAIDFYAYNEMSRSGESVRFVAVEGTTAFTPDPICLLKGAPHPETARRFIRFVLSEPGQLLWCLPAGAPDGPKDHALFRQPIRKDIYDSHAVRMLKPLVNPFVHSTGFKLNQEALRVRVGRLLGPLMKAAALDNKKTLRKAWRAILDAGRPAGLLKEFAALPDDLADEQTALATARKLGEMKPRQRELATAKWQRFFRDKYEKIIAQAGK